MGPAVTRTGADPVVRRRLVVRGVVQGVGFRPFVAALAAELGLDGVCHNDSGAVEVEVQGPAPAVARFAARLVEDAPPLAAVESVESADVSAVGGEAGFRIEGSRAVAGARTMVPPDTATCAACLAELADPGDRRHRHPFITCTHCGPRLTITLDLPYDRSATTMAAFPMCAACAAEYADPGDRRYHAQPIACHDCGPTLQALRPDGRVRAHGTEESLGAAIELLRAGGSSRSRASVATTSPATRRPIAPSPPCGSASAARSNRSRSWPATSRRPGGASRSGARRPC